MKIYEKLLEIKKKDISLVRDTKAYNYKYATLDQIQNKLNPVLNELWLFILHRIEEDTVFTRIIDAESWEFVESGICIKTQKAQDRWSEITYYRRYNLVCLFDLEVEDDDWKKAQDSKPKFTEKEYELLVDNKKSYADSDIAIEKISNKYEIPKEYKEKIKDLYDELY